MRHDRRKGNLVAGAGPEQRVVWTVVDGVADVRLNRPDKLNALDIAMFEGLTAAGEALAGDREIRAVVLSGEGRAFCSGLDVGVLAAGAPAEGTGADRGPSGLLEGREPGGATNRAQRVAWQWAELPVPVIAAIHGVAFGGGIQIALAADVRIAAPDSRLSVMETRWGLIPDMTGTYTLPRTVGLDVAKELTWTGRIVSGEEAYRFGLVTHLSDDPHGTALALAGEIAGRSPDAVRLAKRLLNHSLGSTPAAQFAAEEAAARSTVGTANQREAVLAGLEGRPPHYGPPTVVTSTSQAGSTLEAL